MTGIFWGDDGVLLKTFSSTTNSKGTSVVKIELVIENPYDLFSVIRQLKEIKEARDACLAPAPRQPRRPSRRAASAAPVIDSAKPPLQLTYRGDDE